MKKQKGQVMLITVVMISSAILTASSLAGLLILFQLRQASDIAASTEAIFAADSGIECVLFNNFRTTASPRDCGEITPVSTFSNGAEYKTVSSGASSTKSVGRSGRTARSFEITF